MRNRVALAATLLCLVVIVFAAGANAVVIRGQGASSRQMTSNRPVTFTGPPTKVEVCTQDDFNDGAQTGVADLIAGQHYDVGEVYFEAYESLGAWYLRVTYQTTGDWYLTEFHVYVGDAPPPKSAPGQFPYGGEISPGSQDWMVDGIPFDGGCQIVAAHAVVEDQSEPIWGDEFDLDEFAASLPECVDTSGDYPAADIMAYFDITVTDGWLSGDYYGWCVDTDQSIGHNFSYPTDVWSSYDPSLPAAGLIEYPENLDLVNWILNQTIVGEESTGNGKFTFGDVQKAIWALLDDEVPDDPNTDPTNTDRIAEILAMAYTFGEEYEPGCGDLVGVILVPVDACGGDQIKQLIMIPVPAECDVMYGDETAWAKADGPVGSDQLYDCGWKTGWGSYMQFCFELPPD